MNFLTSNTRLTKLAMLILLMLGILLMACGGGTTNKNKSFMLAESKVTPGEEVTANLVNINNSATVTVDGINATISSRSADKLVFVVPATVDAGNKDVVIDGETQKLEIYIPEVVIDREWTLQSEEPELDLTGFFATSSLQAQAVDPSKIIITLDYDADDKDDPITVETKAKENNKLAFVIPNDIRAGVYTVRAELNGWTFYTGKISIAGGDIVPGEVVFVVKAGVTESDIKAKLASGFDLSQSPEPLGANAGVCSGQLVNVSFDNDGLAFGRALSQLKTDLSDVLYDYSGIDLPPGENPGLVIDPKSGYGIKAVDHLGAVQANAAQERGLSGQGITIAVLDTGVSPHEELGERLLAGYDFVDDDNNPADELKPNGHGTAIATLAAGTTLGVAPEASVRPVRVCGDSACQSTDVIRGMCYALKESKPETLIINLSLGGESPLFIPKFILKEAIDKGVLIAAAAGNEGTSQSPEHFPAAYNLGEVVAVAALEQNADNSWKPADFSTRGVYVDIAVPGVGLTGGTPSGGYFEGFDGTSFSSGLVAGALALWRQANPAMKPFEIEAALKAAASNIPNTNAVEVGAGILDLSIKPDIPKPPIILDFSANPSSGGEPLTTTFSWEVVDPNGDSVSCTLDPADGSAPYEIDNCIGTTSQIHEYKTAAKYAAVLTATDEKDSSVSETFDVTVTSPETEPTLTVNILRDTVVPFGYAQYEITITNPTSTEVSSLILEQTVRSDLFLPVNSSNLDGGALGTQVIQWDLKNLAAGDSIVLTPIIGIRNLEDATTIQSDFELTYAGGSNPIKENTTITVETTPVLELVANSNRSLVSSDDVVTYTLNYTNQSTDINATDSILTARVPDGTTFVSASDGGNHDSGIVTWNLDVLSPKEYGQVQFTVTVGSLSQGQVFTTEVELTSSEETAPTARASATNILEEEDPLDVAINILRDTVVPFGYAQYEITITNPTSTEVSSLILEQTVRSDLFLPVNSSNLDGGALGTQVIQWDLKNLAAGDSIVLTPIIGIRNLEDATLIPSTFELSYAGTKSAIQIDTTFAVEDEPVLELLAHTDRSLVSNNDTITYTLNYTNQSTNINATDSILTARVPDGTTFVSASDGGNHDSGIVTWNLDVLSPKEYGQVQFTVTVGSLVQGNLLTSEVELTSSESEISTARASATNVVEDEDPVEITVMLTSETVESFGYIQYEISIANSTSQQVSSLILEQTVRSDLFLPVNASDLDGGALGTQVIRWDLGNLPANSSINRTPIIGIRRLEDATLIPSTFELSYAGTKSAIQVDTSIAVDSTP